jgi:membrane protein implicated in regulation of membrane protease activity
MEGFAVFFAEALVFGFVLLILRTDLPAAFLAGFLAAAFFFAGAFRVAFPAFLSADED